MSRLKHYILKRKIKQKILAEYAGVSEQVISYHCRKGIRNIKIAGEYSKILNCDPNLLLEVK